MAIRTSGWVNITHRTDNTRRIVIQHGAHTKNGQKIAKTLHCRGPRAMPKYTQYFSSVAQTVDCVGFDTPWTCPNNLQTRNRSQFCGLRRRQRWWSAKHSRGGFHPSEGFSAEFWGTLTSLVRSILTGLFWYMEAFFGGQRTTSGSACRAIRCKTQVNK